MIEKALQEVLQHPDYRILRRVPQSLPPKKGFDPQMFVATIIDLETMGLNPENHEIIELGMLSFVFSTNDGILEVIDTYNELNDPGKPIPPEITKVTHITNEAVKGKYINWDHVNQILQKTHLIICHNSGFDRKFLELQTPGGIAELIKNKPFGCTLNDINWKERGIESSKLDYINWKLGYFYEGHRALNDCWATLNPLIYCEGAFDELKDNVRRKETLICAENAPFDKKDQLKSRGYRWSDGTLGLPKSWWICINNDLVEKEKQWLEEVIYCKTGVFEALKSLKISAYNRYSLRAERI